MSVILHTSAAVMNRDNYDHQLGSWCGSSSLKHNSALEAVHICEWISVDVDNVESGT